MEATLACRALRRVGFCTTRVILSQLVLRNALVRDGRAAAGEFGLDGGCGVGVLRRLADRTPLRTAIVLPAGAFKKLLVGMDASR